MTGLNESSMYTFNISATNAFGTSQAISLNVTLPECSTQTTTNTTVSSSKLLISVIILSLSLLIQKYSFMLKIGLCIQLLELVEP